MTWLLVLLLIAFIALAVACLIIGPPDPSTTKNYTTTAGYVFLATIAAFFLLQIVLVISVCTTHTLVHRHHERR